LKLINISKVEEVRRQLHSNPKIKTGEEDPDYKACVRISTQASLKEMIAPGLLVIKH
jgi:H+-translocating diphosphatase